MIYAARKAHAGGKEAPQRVVCFALISKMQALSCFIQRLEYFNTQLRAAAAAQVVVVFVVLTDFDARVDVEVLPCDGLGRVVGRWSATDEALIGEDQRVSRVLFWEPMVGGILHPLRNFTGTA